MRERYARPARNGKVYTLTVERDDDHGRTYTIAQGGFQMAAFDEAEARVVRELLADALGDRGLVPEYQEHAYEAAVQLAEAFEAEYQATGNPKAKADAELWRKRASLLGTD